MMPNAAPTTICPASFCPARNPRLRRLETLMKSSTKPTRPMPVIRNSPSSPAAVIGPPVSRCPVRYPASAARMITMPPMVGVPLLLSCPAAASSSWISWPMPCLTKMRIATGVPSSAIAIDTAVDSKRVLKDPPRCRAEPSYPGPYRPEIDPDAPTAPVLRDHPPSLTATAVRYCGCASWSALGRGGGLAVDPVPDAAGQGRHRERAVVEDGGVEGGQREGGAEAAAGLVSEPDELELAGEVGQRLARHHHVAVDLGGHELR